MVHVIKVYFQDPTKETQIRRSAVNSDVVGKFSLLEWKIKQMFPDLNNKSFEITWKDQENDVIHMSSDDELAQALANSDDGLLKLFIYVSNSQPFKVNPSAKSSHNDLHTGVVCDACDKNISGYRYKCLQCRNYDLCSSCNAADKHAEHDMIKLVKPSNVTREWVFLGSRKMWRSLFGRCPRNFHPFHDDCSTPPEPEASAEPKASAEPGTSWQSVVHNLMKGDHVPAEKLIKENLGHFLDFMDTFANVDVSIHKDTFTSNPCSGTKKPENSKETPAKTTPAEQVSSASKENSLPVDKNTESVKENNATQVSNTEVPIPSIVNENETVKLVDLDTSATESINSVEPQINELPQPQGGLFETSMNAEGWTFINGNENEKKENVTLPSVDNGAKPKTKAIYPEIAESVQPSQIPQEQVCATSEETKPKEAVTVTQDPEILNALAKMQAMGFTNEGGWLERLLITKDGNINSALDALYPNTRRR